MTMISRLILLSRIVRLIVFGQVPPNNVSNSLWMARMYGELIPGYIAAGDSSNAYVLAVRAFHHANQHYKGR